MITEPQMPKETCRLNINELNPTPLGPVLNTAHVEKILKGMGLGEIQWGVLVLGEIGVLVK